ncbi:glycosyltransferase [Pseudoalteromonas phenolica]|uniref:glycosyltransferase n=1 Tax=Pseudoalteromonas phenolica TaxID=161398 RepID=UPI00384BE0A1
MKILVLPSWYPPYGGGFFEAQAEGLLEQQQDVQVLSIERVSPRNFLSWVKALICIFFADYNIRQDKRLSVIVSQIPGIPRLDRLHAFLYAYKSYKVFKKFSKNNDYTPDVIHAHSLIWAGFAAFKIKSKFNIPYIVTEHRGRFSNNQFVSCAEKKEMSLLEVALAAQHASKILCVSSVLIPFIKSIAPSSNIETLPNLVNTESFKVKTVSPKKGTVFICVASLIPLKNHENLLRAFHEIVQSDDLLYIVGDGVLKEKLKLLCKQLDLCKQVYFAGHASPEQVAAYLEKSDVFVLPSKYEAFGVVYIEAMSVGLPVIASKGTGAVDFVDSENGRLVEPSNINELAETMLFFKENKTKFNVDLISLNVKENYKTNVIIKSLIEHLTLARENNT